MSIFKKFNDFITEEEKERNIQQGHICKCCYQVIDDMQNCGKPTLCESCAGSLSNSQFCH